MARNQSPEENDPSFHRENLRKHIEDIKKKDLQKGIAYEDFIKKLMEIFTDNPPHSWRFRATKDRAVFFRVHRTDTGRTNNFLLPLHDGLIIMTEFFDEKFRDLFPKTRDFYGKGEKAPINYATLSESLREKYLDAIKTMATGNDKWRIDSKSDAKQFIDSPGLANTVPKSLPHEEAYLPNREKFEATYRSLVRIGHEVSIDGILDKIEHDAKRDGLKLKDSWRMITERNIREYWSKK